MLPLDYRVFIPATGHIADGNALRRYAAEGGSWIWAPNKASNATAILRFRLSFVLKEAASPLIHVTGDQRFQLRCDGRDISFGPDRCDVEHWTVQSLKLELPTGRHELEAVVWFIGEPGSAVAGTTPEPKEITPPMAQMTWRGGFLVYAEGVESSLLNTGEAPWTVEDLTDAVAMNRPRIPHYHDVGPVFTFDLGRWAVRAAQSTVVVEPPLQPNVLGVRRPGRCLYPADLAEQRREPWAGGVIRAFRPAWDDAPWRAGEICAPEITAWQELLDRATPLTIAAGCEVTVLWDFEDYQCGYPLIRAEGGEGAMIAWSWAEGLYEEAHPEKVGWKSSKGHRGEIEGKVFLGMEDRWRIGPGGKTETPSLWWRCGRYARLRVKTDAAPLILTHLGLITTGYPLDRQGKWQSSDPAWDRLMSLFERTYRIAAHETWVDTPYYEQLCYVADNLMTALANYAWFGDARLSRRSIELFEWSRHASGLVAERYPSGRRQESATFSLLWPVMVRDYAWWRDDVPFIRAMLPGLRGVLSEFDGFVREDGLLHGVPGWPFVDWVPEWPAGCGPGVREGDSCIVNLLWVLALLATAQVEDACGDSLLSQRCRRIAGRAFDQILTRFWDEKRGLLLDTAAKDFASEHAQAFALLTGLLDPKKTEACLAALRKGEGLAKATISASFYVLEALHRHGQADEFHRRLAFWQALPGMGFKATPERHEPNRSDSHVWSAHPAWHTLAGIAGVRPDAPGFARVRIAPLPGPLDAFDAVIVHPRGRVEVAFRRGLENNANFTIVLPEGITGTLEFTGQSHPMEPGKNEIAVSSAPGRS